MMRSPLLPIIVLACLGGGASAAPALAAQQDEPVVVLAQDLRQLGAWAQWTRRDGYCTVQVLLTGIAPQLPGTVAAGGAATPPPKVPVVQVWLLRANGTAMPTQRVKRELPRGRRESTATYTYAFQESASREAAAVAVMIDGRYFIERLEPFPDQK